MTKVIALNINKSIIACLIFYALFFNAFKSVAQCPTVQASFTLSVTELCTTSTNNIISFTNTSTGSSANTALYDWYIGSMASYDKTTAGLTSGTLTVIGDGDGFIYMVATANGCHDTAKIPLVVSAPPTANFTFDNNNKCAGTVITFTNTSTSAATYATYLWDFGDGNTSTLKNPTHAYALSGSYNVKLTTMNSPNCENVSPTKSITVAAAPEADFTFPANQCTNNSVSFTDASVGTDGSTTYSWNFGDAGTSTQKNPTHTYTTAGSYNVTLTVSNGPGCSNTSPVAVITIADAPTSTFTFNNNNQCAGTVISFNNTSGNTAGGTTYSWDFGDNNSSIQKNPTHTYNAAGTYTVTLTVSNGSNCNAVSLPTLVTVTSSPVASFTVANNNQCAGAVVSFTNTTTGTTGGTSYQWDFGDGNNSTAINPTHVYASGGNYNVKLTATNGGSCSTISPATVVAVKATPLSTFTFNSASCTSMSVSFTNTSTTTGATGTYLWTFGDGNTSTLENPTNVYASAGTYDATLKITNAATGCSNTSPISKIIVGNLPPVLGFTMSPLTGCSPRTVTFTNTSSGAAPASNYDWDFGNGTTLTGVKDPPTQLYHEGTWTVRLISGNSCGIDTLYQTIVVDTLPKAIATPQPLKGCLPINFTALNNSTGGNLKYQWFVNGILTDTTKLISNKLFTTAPNTVKLSVSNSCGTDDTTFTITSSPTVEAVISPLKSTICSANDFSFTYTQTSVGDSLTYFWDFDNGNTSSSPTPPAQTFINPGTYHPVLIVKNSCGSDTSIATLTVYPVPTAPVTRDTLICYGTAVSLVASGGGPQAKYEWYDVPGGTLLTVGAVYKTPTLTTKTTYYVQVTLLDCTSPLKAVTVNIKPLPLPPTTSNDTICSGDSTILTAVGVPGNGFEWYSASTGGALLSTSANFQTPALTTTTNYFVQAMMAGCASSTRVKATVQITPIPSQPTVPKVGVCVGNIATVTATAPGGTYQWYDAPTNGNLLQKGATFITPVLNTDATYYIQTQIAGCTSPRKAVVVTATPVPFVDILADDTLGCVGMEVNFKTNATTGANYSWFFLGGSPLTSTQYTPVPIKYTFVGNIPQWAYLTVDMNGCKNTDSILIKVKPYPDAQYTVNTTEGCSPVTVAITNTSTAVASDTYLWDFGNGTTSNLTSPAPIKYTATGTDSAYQIKLIISSPGGCADTSVQQIDVHSNPIVSFKSSVNTTCVNNEVTFTSESINALAWKWYLGDGTISTDKLVKHTYTTSGTYTVKLVVVGSFGCSDSVSHDVVVNANPIANYTATTICNTSPTAFTDFSTGAISWEWNFGDASPIDNSKSPLHLFPHEGTYDVILRVKNALGCIDSSIQKITVLERPLANFVFKNSCAKDVVNFKDSTKVTTPTGWSWDFGDGSTSTSQNTQHIYAAGGNYPVQLIVRNDVGCSDTITKMIKVSTVPTPLFKANVSCLGKVTSFTDLSTDSEPIIKWFYDFNDGNNSVSQNPNYIYSNAGTYNVSLTVTNINGCDSTFTQAVSVDVVPKANYVADTICIGNPTSFTDISVGNVIKWEWDFGDGTFDSVGPTTKHVYPAAGSYLTSLKIYTLGGCTDEKFKIVVVRNDVTAALTVKDSACMYEQVMMYDKSISAGMIVSTAWNFGDGSPEVYTTNATHAYAKSGVFIITHKVIGLGGCENKAYDTIYISPAPDADFVSANTCANQSGSFIDKSTGSPVTWDWDFNDGDTSKRQNPKHVFLKAGAYNVQLKIKTALGCGDTTVKRVTVYASPVASFTSNVACWGDTTNFTNTSNPMDGSIIKTWWDFDDSTYSIDLNPNHVLVIKKDTFHVKMVIVTSHGCYDTVEQVVTTHPIPTFKYNASSYSGCNPFTATFHDSSTVPGGTIVNWLWDFGDKSLTYNNDPTHIYTTDGHFFVSLMITSSYGCRMRDTLKYPIVVYPKPVAEFTVNPKETSMYEPSIKIMDESVGATLWNWDLGDKTTSIDQNITHVYADTGIFVITQIAMNQYGCKDTAFHEVRINGEPTVFIPNAFTPDGNGLNDVFMPKMFGVREFSMTIYNRWGDLIFISNDVETGWNGKVNGTGETVKDDTYIYKIYIRDLRGNPRIFKGKITVIKKGEEPD
ncbi:MAG TPA: PKD domain-containing protein [Bacteroidia bacterium]|jgi:gliding motility-associated-like protein|nr:PKD domain-containing protein [Bacteroidia bacterium]